MNNSNYILSLESSSDTCGVAVSDGEIILAAANYFKRNLHDKLLADLTRRILADLNIGFEELSAVAISAGPGSFTGLRISAALAKGLCFEGNIKFIAVPNLDAFAYSAVEYSRSLNLNRITSIIISHKDVVYLKNFNFPEFNSAQIETKTIEELSQISFDKTLIVGTGAYLFSQNFNVELFKTPKVEFIAKLAAKMYSDSAFSDIVNFEPTYIQDFIPKHSTKKLDI